MPRKRHLVILCAALLGALVVAAPGSAHDLPGNAPEHSHAHSHGADGLWLDPPSARAPGAAPYDVRTHAGWNAGDWDGRQYTTDQPDLTGLPGFHAVYLYPKDGTNRFAQFAAMLQADAAQSSQRLRDTYGRGVRFDYRAGACMVATTGTAAPCLDITVIKSRLNSGQFKNNPFGQVKREIDRVFPSGSKKYAVWLDATYTGACGQGHLYQDTRRIPENNNRLRTLAVVYKPYASDAATGGFCRGRVLLHELGHNMGALQNVAPNAFDGAHCDDSNEDVMCYEQPDAPDTGAAVFDWGTNDYWDPIANPDKLTNPSLAGDGVEKLPWWTVNLSQYICPTTGCQNPNTPEY